MREIEKIRKSIQYRKLCLGKEQHFFSVISDFIDCLIVILDQQGQIVYYNKACEYVTDLTWEEARGKNYWDVFCQLEEKELYKEFFNLLDPAQYPLEVETQLFTPKGYVLTIYWKYNALEAEDGAAYYHVLTGIDVTNQENTKKALLEIGEKYRTIIHASPVTVISLDKDFRIKSWSSAAERLLGWPEAIVLDKKISSFLEDQYGTLQKSCEKAVKGKVIYDLELSCSRKNGSPVEVHLSLAPRRSYQGTIEGIVLIALDITERKQAEQQIADYAQELESLYRHLDQEMDKAREIHERTLPATLPQIEGISMSAYYQPAQKIGGDFYDVIQIGDKLVFYLSDFSGHGLDSAMLSVFVKNTINSFLALVPEEEISPDNILHHLSKLYYQESYPDDYFICIFLAVLDLQTKVLSYTGAGFHVPPLARLENETIKELISQGLPISSAVSPELLELTEDHLQISPGTTLFFTTDGLVEQSGYEDDYEIPLKNAIEDKGHLPPEMAVRAINEHFRELGCPDASNNNDDITLLVFQVNGHAGKSYSLELNSELHELDRLRKTLFELMPDKDEAELFFIGLHELVANAIEHGNKFDPGKKVYLELSITGQYLYAAVEDEGDGFNWREELYSPLELINDSERGRGIPLTKMCGEKLFYNDRGNRAVFLHR